MSYRDYNSDTAGIHIYQLCKISSRCNTIFVRYLTTSLASAASWCWFSAFHHSVVGKWGPALAGKEKAGMVRSVSRWTRGVQVKLWDPLRTCAIPERPSRVVSALASINEVNLWRARLVLRWVTMSVFSSWCWTFILVCNQPPKANSAFHPFGVGKWVPASAGKAKAGMVHSVSGWRRGVQVKLRSLENACHTWAP